MRQIRLIQLILVIIILSCKPSNEENAKINESNRTDDLVNQKGAINQQNSTEKPSDFDFLIGEWNITSKQLKERLANSNKWVESTAHSKCWKVLNGYGNMDEFSMTTIDNKLYVGNTIRVYNPQTKEWSLYWTDNFNLQLGVTYQTKGTFKDGVGVFYGDEIYKGKKVRQKFTWKQIDENTAYWDQSYFDDDENKWEVNWIMTFNRVKSEN